MRQHASVLHALKPELYPYTPKAHAPYHQPLTLKIPKIPKLRGSIVVLSYWNLATNCKNQEKDGLSGLHFRIVTCANCWELILEL